jgi:hypothetical protein
VKQVIVTVDVTVRRIVTCEGCTVEQARTDPFLYAVDEQDSDVINWEVLSAKEDDA